MSELCVPVMCYFYTQTATNTHIGPTDYYLFQLSHYSSFRPGVMRAAITAAAAAFAAENFLSLFDQCYVRRMIWPVLVNVNCHCARFFSPPLLFLVSTVTNVIIITEQNL